jgi:hypothetical protein
MIRKSGNRFSEKIMLKQRDEIMMRFHLIASRSRGVFRNRPECASDCGITPRGFALNVVDNEKGRRLMLDRVAIVGAPSLRRRRSGEPLANFVSHLGAKRFASGRPFLLIEIPPVEDIEIFEDRMAIAGHRQNAEEFARGSAGTAHFPPSDRIGAVAWLQATQLCHVVSRQRSADRVGEILAELFQFWTCQRAVPDLKKAARSPMGVEGSGVP